MLLRGVKREFVERGMFLAGGGEGGCEQVEVMEAQWYVQTPQEGGRSRPITSGYAGYCFLPASPPQPLLHRHSHCYTATATVTPPQPLLHRHSHCYIATATVTPLQLQHYRHSHLITAVLPLLQPHHHQWSHFCTQLQSHF